MLEDGFSFKSSLQYTPTDEAKRKGKKNPSLEKSHVKGVPFSHPYSFVPGNFHPSV